MKKIRLTVSFLFIILAVNQVHASRSIKVVADLDHKKGKIGSYIALIIGIQNYNDPMITDLDTPLNDARKMGQVLQTKYGFKVELLLDSKATRKAIYNAVRNLSAKAQPDDSVLIYYAGHGDLDRQYDDGWWIPVDATGGDPTTYLDNGLIQKAMRSMKAKHVLLISDSCYSGTLFGRSRTMPAVIDDNYYLNLYNEKSRWGITSGNKTPVSDAGTAGHSIFAYQLIKKLKNNDRPYITTQEVYTDIAPIIGNNSEQTPLCSPVKGTGDQGGQFIFVATAATNQYGPQKMQSQKVAPPIMKKTSYDDILKSEQELRVVKQKWRDWQSGIDDEYIQVLRIDQSTDLNPSQKKETWKRFLSNVSQNNPFSTRDDDMRSYAQEKISKWDSYISAQTKPVKTAAIDFADKKSKAIKLPDKLRMEDYYDQFIPEPVWPKVPKGKIYRWKMVTTYPPHFPMLGENIDRFARVVKEKSKGRLIISVYGGGELVPPLGVFDAVSHGTAEAGGSAAYYWAGRDPAAQFFATVPFGMNTEGVLQWLHHYGGIELWEEVYSKFNIIPRPAGTMGYQMGGWFNKAINSMDDFKGVKMRIPGLGGKVLAKAGGHPILVAGGEIYTNLDRGVIDATEWVGPFHDLKMGFHKVAKYYYHPGWHEPGTNLEFIFNREAYRTLPEELQQVIDQASLDCERWVINKFVKENKKAFKELLKRGVQVRRFPDPVLRRLEQLSKEVLKEVASSNSISKKVYRRYLEVQKILGKSSVSHDNAYYTSH